MTTAEGVFVGAIQSVSESPASLSIRHYGYAHFNKQAGQTTLGCDFLIHPHPFFPNVLTDQGIGEEGTHEALIRREGLYAHLYRLQFDHPTLKMDLAL